jgi:hypothetical protein
MSRDKWPLRDTYLRLKRGASIMSRRALETFKALAGGRKDNTHMNKLEGF